MLIHHDDDYSQGYAQIKEAFRALTKDNITQSIISLDIFRSSNIRVDDAGYILYVFDKRYEQKFTASQPVKVECKFIGVVPNDVNGYALVILSKLFSIGSDG